MDLFDHVVLFIKNWGYLAILIGSMIEGESIILTASFLASQGYWPITSVMSIVFCGTFITDQALFFLGRFLGPKLFYKFPRFLQSSKKALNLLNRWNTLYILSFRFIYGIRVISSVVIGASGVGAIRFIILNFIAAAIWTIISCSAGYFLGETVREFIINFDIYQKYFIGVFLALIIILILYFYFKKRNYK